MSWRINFTDIQGRNIRIDISGAGESASNVPTVLTASSEPLVTEIDRDEDMMKPSRLSSGYISVINEGNLSGLMPTNDMEHSVKIYSDGELAWQGYMQSENYGRDMYLEKEEAKFAISDALSSLGAVDMEDMDAFNMQNMASYIAESIGKVSGNGLAISYVEIPDVDEFGLGVGGWLTLSCQRKNFFVANDSENDDDPDWQKYDVLTYLGLLEEISKMMGYTVCLDADTLRFVSQKTRAYVRYTEAQMRLIGSGASVSGSSSALLSAVYSLSSEQSSALDNTLTTVRGKKLVNTKCDVNAIGDVMPEISLSGLKYLGVRESSVVTGVKYRALAYESKQTDVKLTEWRLNSDGSYTNIGYGAPGSEGLSFVRADICKADIYNSADVENGSKKSYEYSEGVIIRLYGTQYSIGDALEVVKVTGGVLPRVKEGCFSINFGYKSSNTAERVLTCALKVGAYWAGANGWSVTSEKLYIRIIGGAIVSNKTLDQLYEGASGYVVPIKQPLSGQVEFYVYYDSTSAGFGDVQLLSDLSIKYCNVEQETAEGLKDTSTYSARTGLDSQSNANVELRMVTKTAKCKDGYGILYQGAEKVESGLVEKSLLSLMKEVYGENRDEAEPTLRGRRRRVGECYLHDGATWQVLAESRNWRDADSKLLLYKL